MAMPLLWPCWQGCLPRQPRGVRTLPFTRAFTANHRQSSCATAIATVCGGHNPMKLAQCDCSGSVAIFGAILWLFWSKPSTLRALHMRRVFFVSHTIARGNVGPSFWWWWLTQWPLGGKSMLSFISFILLAWSTFHQLINPCPTLPSPQHCASAIHYRLLAIEIEGALQTRGIINSHQAERRGALRR